MALLHRSAARLLKVLPALLLTGCGKPTAQAKPQEPIRPAATKPSLPETISFNEHIQPILSEYCYQCHGPDSGTRRPDKEPLRLDRADDAFKVRDFGAPVMIKGKPDESELVKLIRSQDPDEVMPPPESHKVLGAREIALLEKWIAQGAKFEGHWSYQPVVRAAAPKNDWSDKPIDGFVFEKLAEAGLKPNVDQDARRFHRRLSFDLTGLPPAPATTDAFVTAYEKDADAAISAEADRMLATVQSAEHFARQWLDAARYGDTHGIQIDNYRSIWPYRDWVIRAFQQNMPWDEFTTEQLAGDLLENPTLDQKIATGFNRCLVTTGEGGILDDEYNAIYARDQVDTMGAIWLGLSASCASCHDHKFDPFSTKEFYQFTAFFRNNTMAASNNNSGEPPPTIFVPLLDDREKWTQLGDRLAAADKALVDRRETAKNDYETWLQHPTSTAPVTADPTLAIHFPFAETDGPATGIVDGRPLPVAAIPTRVDGPAGKAVVVSGGEIELGDIGGFSPGDQVSFGCFVWFEGKPTGAIVSKMNPGQAFRGWDLYLQEGRFAADVIDTWDQTAIKLETAATVAEKQWHHVMVTFDGVKGGKRPVTIFVDGKRAAGTAKPNGLGKTFATEMPLRFGARGDGSFKSPSTVAVQDFRLYRRLLGDGEIAAIANDRLIAGLAALPREQRTPDQEKILFEHFLGVVDAPSVALLREKADLAAELAQIRARGSATLVFEEKKDLLPKAHILIRGQYSSPGEEVIAATPAMLPPMPAGAPANRLGLAMWLNEPQNPLPARVTMNRLWYHLFGTGIVETTGDFGIIGARPSHPKLLDWLASEFVKNKWDYRHMVKAIVSSRAYRQSQEISPVKLEKDPANRLISHGPRTRLEAEQLRDMALESAGILSEKVGGPSVKPYQPDGVWEAIGMKESNTRAYQQDHGEALHRRSLYTFWKRTAMPAAMEIFNAPPRESVCVRRDMTNTPLQALVLMNDTQFVEAARVLAQNALQASGDFDARLDFISQRLLDRKFAPAERASVRTSLEEATAQYTAHPDQAQLAIAVGELKPDEKIPPIDLAAWTLVTVQLLNLDETVTR